MSVTVPTLPSLPNITLTPGIGTPSLSVTVPRTVRVWANAEKHITDSQKSNANI